MDQQWQAFSDTRGRHPHATSQQHLREMNNGSSQQPPPQSGYGYEAYQTPSVPSHPQSMAVSPIGTPRARNFTGDGDVVMEDADPYNRLKYPSRPNHQHRASAPYLPNEDSSAARRYSPMKALSPSNHFPQTPQQQSQSSLGAYNSQNTSARQSPTRSNAYSTPSQNYYPSPGKALFRICFLKFKVLKYFHSIFKATASPLASHPSRRTESRPILSFIRHCSTKRRFRSRSKIPTTSTSAIRYGAGCSSRTCPTLQKSG